jgi:hypothetical protein
MNPDPRKEDFLVVGACLLLIVGFVAVMIFCFSLPL